MMGEQLYLIKSAFDFAGYHCFSGRADPLWIQNLAGSWYQTKAMLIQSTGLQEEKLSWKIDTLGFGVDCMEMGKLD